MVVNLFQIFIVLIFLKNLFKVRWVMQQHEKIRKKRDYTKVGSSPIKFPDYTRAVDPLSLLRNSAPQSRLQYRNTDAHLIFPDPLFKEQWYMVSRVCVILFLFCFVFC